MTVTHGGVEVSARPGYSCWVDERRTQVEKWWLVSLVFVSDSFRSSQSQPAADPDSV